jgi:hypothetical protein
MFGGVNPSNWGDGNAVASQLSSTKDDLLTLFNKKIYAGKNATVFAEEWQSYSSTNSKHAGALFRIENTTGAAINWTVDWYTTAYGGWNEWASVSVNGVNTWNSGGASLNASNHNSIVLSIPPGQVSTIIFISASTTATTTRGCLLAFDNDCLVLPAGLEYRDDLHTAADGWGN